MTKELGVYLDPEALQSVIEAKMASKTIDLIEGVIGIYSLPELAIAGDINIELTALETPQGDQH